ncbi:MAG TPA: hypothetical protein V6C95_16170 [Coleofasciculaceae cyanobacterium]
MRHTEANYSNFHLNELQDSGFSGIGNGELGIGKKVRFTSLIRELLCSSSTPILRLFTPKMVYLLLCYLLLLGGGLVGCSNSVPLGLSGLSSSAGGNVTKIGTIQQNQNAATVYLQGRVINRAPFLTNGAYKLEDATGTIWVLTNQALPNIGDEVKIVGQVQFQSIPIGGQDLGEVYVQEQRQLESIRRQILIEEVR